MNHVDFPISYAIHTVAVDRDGKGKESPISATDCHPEGLYHLLFMYTTALNKKFYLKKTRTCNNPLRKNLLLRIYKKEQGDWRLSKVWLLFSHQAMLLMCSAQYYMSPAHPQMAGSTWQGGTLRRDL